MIPGGETLFSLWELQELYHEHCFRKVFMIILGICKNCTSNDIILN